ncbi:MAG: ParB/RepB/Spo0J family partition protein [Saprospiraceae bacterium]|nr:ParB/RepB/Spo0J family partition protein [Saprospiraceae bacterium]
MNQKNELGKGIKALLGNINKENTKTAETTTNEQSASVQNIPIEWIQPNAHQPRNQFDQVELEELANSIRNLGLIQPITIRRITDKEYQIISGERRFRAAKMAGLKEVPTYIRIANDSELLEMALVENIQRVDLNPIEIALTYQRLLEEFDITQDKLSDRVGKQRSTISNYIRLLKLSPDIQDAVRNNKLSMGHARVLAGVDNILLQKQFFQKTLNEHLSVRALENMAVDYHASLGKAHSQKTAASNSQDNMIKSLQDKLSSTLGTKVQIIRKSTGEGQVIIRFQSDKALNDILERLDII